MKLKILLLIIIMGSLFAITSFSKDNDNGHYVVIKKIKNIEVREYKPNNIASYT